MTKFPAHVVRLTAQIIATEEATLGRDLTDEERRRCSRVAISRAFDQPEPCPLPSVDPERTYRRSVSASKRFSAWLDISRRSRTSVGAELGVHPSFVFHLAAGRKRPGLKVAAAIERMTRGAPDGAINAEDWLATV